MNQISVSDLAALANAAKANAAPVNTVLVDVREPDEFAGGHVTAAINIPLGQIDERLEEIPTDQTVYLICHSGARSARATAALSARGIDAVNVDGGTTAWIEAGLPTETV